MSEKKYIEPSTEVYEAILAGEAEVNRDGEQVVGKIEDWQTHPDAVKLRDLVLLRTETGKRIQEIKPPALPENSLHSFDDTPKLFPEGENRQFPTEGGRQFPGFQPSHERQASLGFDWMREKRQMFDQWLEKMGLTKLVGKRNKEIRKALKPLDQYTEKVDISQLQEGEKSIQLIQQLQQAVTEDGSQRKAQEMVINVTESPYGKMYVFSDIFKNDTETDEGEKQELFKEVTEEVLEEIAETLLKQYGNDATELLTGYTNEQVKELFIEKMSELFDMADWQTEALGALVDNFGAADIILIAKLFLGKEITKIDLLKAAARWSSAAIAAFKIALGGSAATTVGVVAYNHPSSQPTVRWVKQKFNNALSGQGQPTPPPTYSPGPYIAPSEPRRQEYAQGRKPNPRYFSDNNRYAKVPTQPAPAAGPECPIGDQNIIEAVNKGFEIPAGSNFINTINGIACRAIVQIKDEKKRSEIQQKWDSAWADFKGSMSKMYHPHAFKKDRRSPYYRGEGDTSAESYKVTQDLGVKSINHLRAGKVYTFAQKEQAQSTTVQVIHEIAQTLEAQKGS